MDAALQEETKRRRQQEYENQQLRQENEWLRTLAHISPVGIFRTDNKGRCLYVNERWCELAGRDLESVLGDRWQAVLHPDDLERVLTTWQDSIQSGLPFRAEYRFVQPTGRVVWVLGQGARELNGRGEMTGYVGTVTEITELRTMRDKLEHSHAELEVRIQDRTAELQRMARVVEGSDDAIITSDLTGNIATWNRGAETLFGYSAAEIIGQSTFVFTPEDKRASAAILKRRVRAGEDIHHHETVRCTKSGDQVDVSLSIFTLRDRAGRATGTCAIVRDITGRKAAERRLRRLSWRLLTLQDQERRRLARELHDATAQTLAALCMNLSALARNESATDRARRLIADSLELAEQATKELRSTAYLLHPPLLDESGLPAALRWFVEGLATRSNLKVELDLSPTIKRLTQEMETTFFRVLQESLMNVVRHSGSETATIRLHEDGEWITLEVRDRGRGFIPSRREVFGVGIAGMRERLSQLGGVLLIEPNDPGTAIVARLPKPTSPPNGTPAPHPARR
ncbi:MAG: sensor signal transduction histidine kinase [Chthoniobacter sp.]|nr:sensor signal transduction histidine kinase [Chthoniobacter sp.]